MNDRKVKGKPHIEAKQWASIINRPESNLHQKVFAFAFEDWFETPQGHSFWHKTVNKIEALGR